jgi:4-amino-4-deoxy-L-arabinose transferase-like glycosyltransferase
MRTAEPSGTSGPTRRCDSSGGSAPAPGGGRTAGAEAGGESGRSRLWVWLGLAAVLGGGLGLRLWGLRQGLPYAYNADEADHFVPHAVRMFQEGTLNPHYFSNPPGFTYVLYLLFAVSYGGGAGVLHAFALHPDELYTLARIVAAVLGTGALWLLYATGARLFNRRIGLLAAAIEAVAFLPVFYAHLALNDVPTLAPLTLSLLGSAGVLRKARTSDYLLAGIGLGLACASKYTAGIAVVPLAAAAAARYLDGGAARTRRVLTGIALAGAAALIAFLIANPYAVLDYAAFKRELVHQSTLSAEAQGKLGAPTHGGVIYYLWSLTWGLGWVPALAALGGGLAVWRRSARVGWLLVPAPLLFLAFMGLQGRYFGRWLMPILPILCLLGAFFALQALSWALGLADRAASKQPTAASGAAGPDTPARRRRGGVRAYWPRASRALLATLLLAVVLAQGLIYSVHSGLVLSRSDTRTLTREWMLAHVPAGTRIVVEPVAPDEWAHETRPGASTAASPERWRKYPSMIARLSPSGRLEASASRQVSIEDYERTLGPALIGYYQANGYCWVISGSTQSGRALADPAAVPGARAYYRALARQGEVRFRASPYRRGSGPVAFGFDWSFDYYPLAFERPGPQMTVYRLHGGRCRG